MNLIKVFTLSILLSSSVWAGGQIGSGGNGCTLSTGEWISMEELLYPEIFNHGLNSFEGFKFDEIEKNHYKRIKLSDYTNVESAFRKLHVLKLRYPKTHRALLSMTKLFESAYLVQKSVEGIFEGDSLFLQQVACDSFSPALMTLSSGGVIFFADIWNQLSGQSAEVILIHETLRLAQQLHPAFKSLDNWELQRMSALLFSNGPVGSIGDFYIQKYENALNSAAFVEFDTSKYESFLYRYEVEKFIRTHFLDY